MATATIEEIAKVKRDAAEAVTLTGLGDDQIADIINEQNNIHALAVAYIYALAADKSSAKGSITIGRYRESFTEKADSFRMLSRIWKARYLAKGFAGGISLADKEARVDDEDRPEQPFSVGFQDNPDTKTNSGTSNGSTP